MHINYQAVMNDTLQQMGRNIDNNKLKLSDDGICAIDLGQDSTPIQIMCFANQPNCYFVSLVGDNPHTPNEREKLYEIILGINSHFESTEGITFSVNTSENQIQVHECHDIKSLNEITLEEKLTDFIEKSINVRKIVSYRS